MVLCDGSGNSFVHGVAEAGFQCWRPMGQRHEMDMIHRVEQVITRAEDYDFLLALCRNEIPRSAADDLLVQ